MPYVSVHTPQPVDDKKLDTLQKEIGRLIPIIPGKTVDNCMTEITGNCKMYMGGGPANVVFCEIRLFGPAPKEKKAELVTELDALFKRELGAEKIYISYLEFAEWGTGGQLKSL